MKNFLPALAGVLAIACTQALPTLAQTPCDVKGIKTDPAAPAVNTEYAPRTNTFNWYYGQQYNGRWWNLNSSATTETAVWMPWEQSDNTNMTHILGKRDLPKDRLNAFGATGSPPPRPLCEKARGSLTPGAQGAGSRRPLSFFGEGVGGGGQPAAPIAFSLQAAYSFRAKTGFARIPGQTPWAGCRPRCPMPYKFSDILTLLKSTGSEFMDNNSLRHSAALSYYTIFSLPPLLLIVITVASRIYGGEALTGQIYGQLKGMVGADAAKFLQDSIATFIKKDQGPVATAVGLGTLVFAATTFFATLQDSLNDIWNLRVNPQGNGIWAYVRQRLLSFGLILSVAFLLLISFVVSATLAFFTSYLQRKLPEIGLITIRVVDISLSLFVTTLLFALIFRFLPDAIIRWRDVGVGAFITALLFLVGKYLISFYITQAEPGSAFGAAGSAIVLLVWIYYSSLILFFGAEFTQEFADHFGQKVQPRAYAVRIKTIEVAPGESDEAKATGRPQAEGRWRG